MNQDEQRIFNGLVALKFSVKKIEEKNTKKSCDLFVEDKSDKYLIEIKSRDNDNEIVEALLQGEIISKSLLKTKVYDAIDRAVRQLDSHQELHCKYKLVWISLNRTYDVEVESERICNVLYGARDLISFTGEQKAVSEKYLYFANSSFYKYKQLAGVIVEQNDYINCLLNDYFPFADKFKETKLGRFFVDTNRLFDPREAEKSQKCRIVRCEIDRQDEAKVLEFVKSTFGLSKVVISNFEHEMGLAITPKKS